MNIKNTFSRTAYVSFVVAITLMLFTSYAIAQDAVSFDKAPPWNVTLGESDTGALCINNNGSSTIGLGLSFQADSSSDFVLNASSVTIDPGQSINVNIDFTPSMAGTQTAVVLFQYGFGYWSLVPNGYEVTGTGVEITAEEPNEISPLLARFHELVEDEQIKGKGHGKRAERRLWAFTKMIERAYLAVEQEKKERAYYQLKVANKQIKRTLKGPGIPKLREEMKVCMNGLGCEEKAPKRWHKKMKKKYWAYKSKR